MSNQFEIKDFYFKKVNLLLESNQNNNKTTKILITFLIDEKNFIHDYKVNFKKLKICNVTTESHKNKNSKRLEFRKKVLEILNIPHYFVGEINDQGVLLTSNKNYIEIDEEKLKKLNEKLKNKQWYPEITFKNIDYVITGSNPGGEGKNKKTFFVWKNKNKNYKVGFLLQILFLKQKFISRNYEEVWSNIYLEEISFESYIQEKIDKSKTILDYLNLFNDYPAGWKYIKKEFEESINKNEKEWEELHIKIKKLRNKFKKNVKKEFEKWKIEDFCIKFFEPGSKLEWEYAHIKPVHLIKKEYLENNSKSKLEEIADPNNFLPLPTNIHKLFDSNQIFWNIDGVMIKKISQNFDEPKDLSNFERIKNELLSMRKKYFECFEDN